MKKETMRRMHTDDEIRGIIFAPLAYPPIPSGLGGKSFYFNLHNGALQWQNGNGFYLHTVEFAVEGSSTNFTFTIICDSGATPFIYDEAKERFINPQAKFIIFANCGDYIFHREGANAFSHYVHEFDDETGSFSTLLNLEGVISDTITPLG